MEVNRPGLPTQTQVPERGIMGAPGESGAAPAACHLPGGGWVRVRDGDPKGESMFPRTNSKNNQHFRG